MKILTPFDSLQQLEKIFFELCSQEKNKENITLELSGQKISMAKMGALLHLLGQHPEITSLDLRGRHFEQIASSPHPISYLAQNSTLRFLLVSKFEHQVFTQLLIALQKHPSLTALHAENCEISTKGMQFLTDLVKQNRLSDLLLPGLAFVFDESLIEMPKSNSVVIALVHAVVKGLNTDLADPTNEILWETALQELGEVL